MSNIKRSSIVGFHNIKNKVSRNAFDLSHRHMFTAQIGELLPVFVQWANPNETFKLGYNGFTRTAPLQTAAFTRLKENIQYYFVPLQSLWKYFEQQVNNMTSGQSGENISRIAVSATADSTITTGMPYINYSSLSTMFNLMLGRAYDTIVAQWNKLHSTDGFGYRMLFDACTAADEEFSRNEVLTYASTAKLLRALGYYNGNADTYDIVSSCIAYGQTLGSNASMTSQSFRDSKFGLHMYLYNRYDVENAPNLSIFPLLAYQKVVNDHYLYRQWQAYKSYACNIDYLQPSDSMNFFAKLGNNPYSWEGFKMQYSNLPLDYFIGVLPKAQYGDESAASVNYSGSTLTTGVITNWQAATTNSTNAANLTNTGSGKINIGGTASAIIQTPHQHTINLDPNQDIASLKISSLRSAIALQKYKEIQESNDSDFASQVLAHFGIKPKHDDYKSVFIGGGDSVIDINPQVNQNLADDNDPDIKAIGAGQLSCGCKFTSDTYGIIIGIYRCVPQLDVAKTGLDRNLFKTDASDFPIPELDNIGMQTQYRSEIFAPRIGTKDDDYTFTTFSSVDMSKTYGYLPRYAELKTSYDRYEGGFLDAYKSWVTGYNDSMLSSWMAQVGSTSTSYPEITDLISCSPKLTYPLFVDQTSACANNDKLLIGSVCTCVAVRPFSVYGLPYSK